MIRTLVLWSALSGIALSSSLIVGVEPSRQHLYEASSNHWTCLDDSSVVLRADQINDGACDCPDGSDEPGTGACGIAGPQFYCANEGFIPKYISQSKVGDGVCDCCDCSDELLSGVEPFYRGATCSELKESWDKIVETETKRYEEGAQALRKLYHNYNLDSEQKPVDKELLAERIEELSKKLVSNELVLSQTKARYAEQLMADNPMLYEYEQIDVNSITLEIDSSFKQIVQVTKAYESLLKILNSLQDNYSRSLNDRVVNENVKKFNFLKLHSLSKLRCDSKVEEEKRLQLLEYFQQELPTIFAEGRIDKPSSYMIGKFSFVEKMILSKSQYVDNLISKINQLSGLMSDVSENYNVNYQDSGVKDAVEAYKGWLVQSQNLAVHKMFPQEFTQKLAQVESLIQANSHIILASDNQDEMNSSIQNFLQHLNFLKNEIPKIFRPNLRSQIKAHESTVHHLQDDLKLKRDEYEALIRAEDNQEDQDFERLKKLITAISNSQPITSMIDNYLYQITLHDSVYQKEESSNANQVKIGSFKDLYLQKDEVESKYFEYLKSKYPNEDDLFPALTNEIDNTHIEYLIGSLHNINNGLILQYGGGNKCWNGPMRAARVTVHCGKNFQILNVYETTKCNYSVDLEGPIGCNLSL